MLSIYWLLQSLIYTYNDLQPICFVYPVPQNNCQQMNAGSVHLITIEYNFNKQHLTREQLSVYTQRKTMEGIWASNTRSESAMQMDELTIPMQDRMEMRRFRTQEKSKYQKALCNAMQWPQWTACSADRCNYSTGQNKSTRHKVVISQAKNKKQAEILFQRKEPMEEATDPRMVSRKLSSWQHRSIATRSRARAQSIPCTWQQLHDRSRTTDYVDSMELRWSITEALQTLMPEHWEAPNPKRYASQGGGGVQWRWGSF